LLRAIRTIIGGSGLDRHRVVFEQANLASFLAKPEAGPTAIAVAALARLALATGLTAGLASAIPHYGRAPDITQPRKRSPGA
jgi:hypothetical protein